MIKYIFKRILQAIGVILLVSIITFVLMDLAPGSPFASEKSQSPEVLAALNKKYGLDQPKMVQLKNFILNALKGDFGVSLKMQKNRPVIDIIKEMFPTSAKLGLLALTWATLVGVPLGCLAAYNRGKPVDSILRVLTTIGISAPGFVVATLLLLLFGVKLKLLPTMGLVGIKSYFMPVFALGFYSMCYIARLSRSSMLDAIGQDYIRTARSKGVSESKILFKHALKNAFIPVLTYLGPLTAGIITGSMVVESVFSVQGMGRYFVNSVLNRDYPIIMATTLLFATLVVFMNMVVDILYRFIDPRIDLTKGA
ncbi:MULTISPECIES: ABC transporter permease [Peptoniphilus]|uniref:ABC transporter, permease protein n=1 Tax=Peptoniphilus duerdenii ATCC BAA-1640 TaxID=862517 RepID=E0NNU1_9FIRM|nr:MULTISPECIES: ABC transporter permease [Peptoniphilus]EFM24409.1 ABC transporter, permease protein [Peptoniphilus duerdenii ATCC BAA-1640]ERT64851.1 putative oligopeptide transport system permease protein OppB [Peptoniphilus sp. BV3AC2]MDK8275607.1 ABC transporter permease [Peptoniphilus duerdenii]